MSNTRAETVAKMAPRTNSEMKIKSLEGVIAAIATAVDGNGEPDGARSVALARFPTAATDSMFWARPAKQPRSRSTSAAVS